MMTKKTYSAIKKVGIVCKCGTRVITSSVEYFCPRCGNVLCKPVGSGVSRIYLTTSLESSVNKVN